MRGMSESLPVKVTVSSEELREWAGRHADAGHHGVAHVLYKAAAGVETIVEQYERERVAQPPTDAEVAAKALRDAAGDIYLPSEGPAMYVDIAYAERLASLYLKERAERIEKGSK